MPMVPVPLQMLSEVMPLTHPSFTVMAVIFYPLGKFLPIGDVIGHLWVTAEAHLPLHRFFLRWHKRAFNLDGFFLDFVTGREADWTWIKPPIERRVNVGLFRGTCLNVFLFAHGPTLGTSLSRIMFSGLLLLALSC